MLLQCKNGKGRNTFHLAAMHRHHNPNDHLWTRAELVDIRVFTEPDLIGKNVIEYLVETQQIDHLGDVHPSNVHQTEAYYGKTQSCWLQMYGRGELS
mgnify:CR=1 FL=1